MITKAITLLVIVVGAQAAVLNGVASETGADRRIGRRNLCHRKNITNVSCVNGTSTLIPHPDDCRLFYVCRRPRGPPICRQCPRGLFYNPSLKVCDWPAHSGCQQKNETSRVTTARPANSTHHHNGSTPAPGNSTHHHNHHHHHNGSTPAPSNVTEPASNNTSDSGSSNSSVPNVGASNSTAVNEDSVDRDASTNSTQAASTNDPITSTAAATTTTVAPAPAPSRPKRKPRWWELWH